MMNFIIHSKEYYSNNVKSELDFEASLHILATVHLYVYVSSIWVWSFYSCHIYLGIFNVKSIFWRPKLNLIFLKTIFLFEYQIRKTTFIYNFFYFIHLQKKYLVLLCPVFDGSSLFLFTGYVADTRCKFD